MNRKGLELLNENDNNQSEELKTLLQDNCFSKDFKRFIKTYKVGPGWIKGDLLLIDEKSGDQVGLTQLKMFEPDNNPEKYHACLDYIFDYPSLHEETLKYHSNVEQWNRLGFIQIGILHWSDVLLLGVEKDKRGQIWRYGTGLIDNQCSKLDNNIFDFISRLHESIDQEMLDDYNLNIDTIYKNPTEQFWRIKK